MKIKSNRQAKHLKKKINKRSKLWLYAKGKRIMKNEFMHENTEGLNKKTLKRKVKTIEKNIFARMNRKKIMKENSYNIKE